MTDCWYICFQHYDSMFSVIFSSGRKLYWTMTSLRGVYLAELNGTHVKVLVKNSLKPRGIALHPGKG